MQNHGHEAWLYFQKVYKGLKHFPVPLFFEKFPFHCNCCGVYNGALFIPSWPIVSKEKCGENYLWWPIITGLIITVTGQLIRGFTIGLAYIVRGGKEGKPYAEGLVTEGIFNHCRNPLYVGNILMLLGVGILANSLLYVAIVIPVFLFIYQAIVLAEEDFLRKKFGSGFDEYCKKKQTVGSLT